MNEPVRWGNARGVPAAGPPGAAAPVPAPAPAGGAVGAAHQALLNVQGPSGFQPYIRPKYFHLRVCESVFISRMLPIMINAHHFITSVVVDFVEHQQYKERVVVRNSLLSTLLLYEASIY